MSSFERGFAGFVAGGALGAGIIHRMGASRPTMFVGSVMTGIALAKILGRGVGRESVVGGDLGDVRLSLNVGETVLFPLSAGVVMAMGAGPERKTDAQVLLGTAALGAVASAIVLSSKKGGS